jgi:hypothetical protein
MDYIVIEGKRVVLNFVFLTGPPFWNGETELRHIYDPPMHFVAQEISAVELKRLVVADDVTEMWLARCGNHVYIYMSESYYEATMHVYMMFFQEHYRKNQEPDIDWKEAGF